MDLSRATRDLNHTQADDDVDTAPSKGKAGFHGQRRSSSPGSTRLPSEQGTLSSFATGKASTVRGRSFEKKGPAGPAAEPMADELLEDAGDGDYSDPQGEDPQGEDSDRCRSSSPAHFGFLRPASPGLLDEFDKFAESGQRGGFHPAWGQDMTFDFSLDNDEGDLPKVEANITDYDFGEMLDAPDQLLIRCISQEVLPAFGATRFEGILPVEDGKVLELPFSPENRNTGAAISEIVEDGQGPDCKPARAPARAFSWGEELGSEQGMAGAPGGALLRARRLGRDR